MGSAEGDRQIAIQHIDAGGRLRDPDFPSCSLDQWPEGDFIPMILEQSAKQLLETSLVDRQREGFDDRAVRICRSFQLRVWGHPHSSIGAYRPGGAASRASRTPAKTPKPGRKNPVGSW